MKPIFDNSSLIDWLSGKHRDERYDYLDGHVCLLAQYLNYRGFKGAVVDAEVAILPDRMAPYALPRTWNEIARARPWTFGAALDRAREALTPAKLTGRNAVLVLTDGVDR
jgi:hypothetical protein